MKPLAQRAIIVTGALGGIGQAVARSLAEAGAQIVATDLRSENSAELVAAISALGGVCQFKQADLSIEAEAESVVAFAQEKFGRVDGAFNNAGIEQHGKPLVDLSGAEWRRVLDANLTSMFFCVKHQLRAMKRGGAIVNTSSALGTVATQNAAEYVASKHGVIGLTRSAALEAAASGVRVNAILPGVVATPLFKRAYSDPALSRAVEGIRAAHPIGRFAEPGELGGTVCWLLSDAASFVTGAAIAIDGGLTIQ